MKRRVLGITLAVILIAHLTGLLRSWYTTIWWYDIPMHMAGGAWVGFLFLYFAEDKWHIFPKEMSMGKYVMVVCLGAGLSALFGVAWEFLEFFLDVLVTKKHALFSAGPGLLSDTLGDLANDLIGAFVVVNVHLWRRFRATSLARGMVGE